MMEETVDDISVSLLTTSSPIKNNSKMFVYLLTFFTAIGGFLFGYDTGVISGAMIMLKDEFYLSTLWQEMVISVTVFFAALFSLIGGILNSYFGRKGSMLIASLIFISGSLILSLTKTKEVLLVGRAIVGGGIGIASMTAPVYIAEISPANIRGRLVTFNNVMITFGQFVASCIDGLFSKDKENGWRFMLGLAAVPAFIQFVGFCFLPESPRWLINKNKYSNAREILLKISDNKEAAETEYESLKSISEKKSTNQGIITLCNIFKDCSLRRALIVGCSLQLIQQLSGINTIMYYSATIVQMSGVGDKSTAIWLAAGVAFVNFLFTLVGIVLVERMGRRSLTLMSLTGVTFSLLFLSLGFLLSSLNSPLVLNHQQTPGDSFCYSFQNCADCMQSPSCGYCFVKSPNTSHQVQYSSCLPINQTNPQVAINGRCTSVNETTKFSFASNYCPTKYSIMALVGMITYLIFFAPGMGPMPWTINAEIYPQWARETCNSYSTAVNWVANVVVSLTFLNITQALTYQGAFLLYSIFAATGCVFIFLFLPETKGTRLEDIEKLFQVGWLVPFTGSRSYNSLESVSNESDEED